MSMHDPAAHWNDPERVECFASRDPDHRLVELVEALPYPRGVTVLDLGCAGGRNAEYLARHELDLHALDVAEAMVARTRERVAVVLGAEEAEARVVRGTMDDLSRWLCKDASRKTIPPPSRGILRFLVAFTRSDIVSPMRTGALNFHSRPMKASAVPSTSPVRSARPVAIDSPSRP